MDQIDFSIADLTTFLVYLVASSFLLDFSSKAKDLINQVGIWLVRCSIFLNVGVSVCRTVVMVKGLVKAYGDRMKLIQAKYAPNITTTQYDRDIEMSDTRVTSNWLIA